MGQTFPFSFHVLVATLEPSIRLPRLVRNIVHSRHFCFSLYVCVCVCAINRQRHSPVQNAAKEEMQSAFIELGRGKLLDDRVVVGIG